MEKDIERILFSEEDLRQRVKELGAQISEEYEGKDLILICVLRGASVFMCDLMRAITVPVEIDFMACSSYGSGKKTSGVVQILKDLDTDITHRDVLIVEDILDSGITLDYLLRNLSSRHPNSLRIATLFFKKGVQQRNIAPDFYGFDCPNEFIVGYGLDYAEKYRNLPYVGVLKKEVYTN